MLMPDNTVFVPVQNPNMTGERTKNVRLSMAQRLSTFEEVEKTYTEEEALREASRCLGCPRRWCSGECPAGMPVPEFIKKIREKDYEGAYELIVSASTLPEFCSRLCPQEKQCQSDCTRSIRSEAVGIGRLERFVVEQHYASGNAEKVAPATGKAVAVVGSGPSGLSAAVALCKMGHKVTVIEKNEYPGGLLRYGIPGMKLPEDILDRKLDAMTRMGVAFQTGITATAETVKDYDAVVLAVGTGNARTLKIAGAEAAKDIYPAVSYLSGEGSAQGKDVVIIGGGDTGNDCVGTAIRQGAASITQIEMLPKVTKEQIVYSPLFERQKEVKFDSSQEECLNKFLKDPHLYQTTVKAVETDVEGNLVSVTTVALEKTYDENRRLTMVEIPGSEKVLPCGILIVAAGFIGPEAETAAAFGVETDGRSNILGYKTNAEKIFACGDCHTGQSLVVKAMVDGRKCAEAVDAFLNK
ncbi:MAG: FAD-dependent oxidoreductase [Oscillospiraceae bacterium]|nr:FAD-dependent oxidoreductase [Oscillospiraceae bacterium]